MFLIIRVVGLLVLIPSWHWENVVVVTLCLAWKSCNVLVAQMDEHSCEVSWLPYTRGSAGCSSTNLQSGTVEDAASYKANILSRSVLSSSVFRASGWVRSGRPQVSRSLHLRMGQPGWPLKSGGEFNGPGAAVGPPDDCQYFTLEGLPVEM